jgi:DMSO reductase anchor subunit
VPELKNEWPLVFFTTFAPVGVGAGVVLSSLFKQHELNPLIFQASLTLFATMAVAFIISSVHIGRKMSMPRAIRNVFRSWLSMEIFMLSASCGLFLVTAGMYFFREKYSIETRFINYGFWLASGCGILGLLSMQRVYLLRSVNLWTGPRALSMVFSSAFLLGSAEAVLIMHFFDGKSIDDMLWWFSPVFLAPVFFDAIQVYELKRLGHKAVAIVFGVTRVPVYLVVLHLLGRADLTRLVGAMAIAVAGDILVRLFFFGEQTTSFQTELDRARQARLASKSGSGLYGRFAGRTGD